jgi:hypothetical protein
MKLDHSNLSASGEPLRHLRLTLRSTVSKSVSNNDGGKQMTVGDIESAVADPRLHRPL